MFVMLVGTLLYGWVIAVVASTVSNNGTAESLYNNKLQDTKAYLTVHNVGYSIISVLMLSTFVNACLYVILS